MIFEGGTGPWGVELSLPANPPGAGGALMLGADTVAMLAEIFVISSVMARSIPTPIPQVLMPHPLGFRLVPLYVVTIGLENLESGAIDRGIEVFPAGGLVDETCCREMLVGTIVNELLER
jgi:hypothetical protein